MKKLIFTVLLLMMGLGGALASEVVASEDDDNYHSAYYNYSSGSTTDYLEQGYLHEFDSEWEAWYAYDYYHDHYDYHYDDYEGYIQIAPFTTTRTVTWNANGGSVNPNSWTRAPGGRMGALPAPLRAQHVFVGWFTATAGGIQITPDSAFPSANVTYHARWARAVTITFV